MSPRKVVLLGCLLFSVAAVKCIATGSELESPRVARKLYIDSSPELPEKLVFRGPEIGKIHENGNDRLGRILFEGHPRSRPTWPRVNFFDFDSQERSGEKLNEEAEVKAEVSSKKRSIIKALDALMKEVTDLKGKLEKLDQQERDGASKKPLSTVPQSKDPLSDQVDINPVFPSESGFIRRPTSVRKPIHITSHFSVHPFFGSIFDDVVPHKIHRRPLHPFHLSPFDPFGLFTRNRVPAPNSNFNRPENIFDFDDFFDFLFKPLTKPTMDNWPGQLTTKSSPVRFEESTSTPAPTTTIASATVASTTTTPVLSAKTSLKQIEKEVTEALEEIRKKPDVQPAEEVVMIKTLENHGQRDEKKIEDNMIPIDETNRMDTRDSYVIESTTLI